MPAMKLTEAAIRDAVRRQNGSTKPFKLYDTESGLYLRVRPGAAMHWFFRTRVGGKEQHRKLGVYPAMSRAGALAESGKLQEAVQAGTALATVEVAGTLGRTHKPDAAATDAFNKVAERWFAKDSASLAASTRVRNERILTHLTTALGEVTPIGDIDKAVLREALLKIEQDNGRETAHRALNYARDIWDYAETHDLVSHNPATELRSKSLFAPPREQQRRAITDPKTFGALLRAIDGYVGQPVVRLALQILPRVFTRPGELRLAAWSEFDRAGDAPQWIVPATRTKMRRELIVPLSRQVLAYLAELEQHVGSSGMLFPSTRRGRPLSENTINVALQNLGFADLHVAHGFRTTASSLLEERCGQQRAWIEKQLAHETNGVEGVYNRAEYLEQRRQMMQRWADYIDELRQNHS